MTGPISRSFFARCGIPLLFPADSQFSSVGSAAPTALPRQAGAGRPSSGLSPSPSPDFLHGVPIRSACAALIKESRMRCASASKLHRKSGFRAGLTFGAGPPGLASMAICSVISLPTRAASRLLLGMTIVLQVRPQEESDKSRVKRKSAVESHISRKTSEMPGFPVRGTRQRPRVRLSSRKAAWSSSTPTNFTGNPGCGPPVLG
jgi:hypothetical protein